MKKYFNPNLLKRIFHHLIPNVGSILVMMAILFIHDAHAASLNTGTSPSTISYQGTLSTASGMPINASVGITFRLYNIQSGGTALWVEAHTGTNAVPVANGLFNTTLGSIIPIPAVVWNNTTVYLGIQVEGDVTELSPREMVNAVPMAMMTANITVPDGSITTVKIADGAVTQVKAPSLVASPNSLKTQIYFGSETLSITSNQTVLSKTILITPVCNHILSVLITPRFNHYSDVVATSGSPWDSSKFTVYLLRDNGGIWSNGDVQAFDWLATCD